MKLLFITSLFFSCPPKDGSSIRTFNLIKHLSKDNDLVLVCIKESKRPKEDLSQLKKYCRRIVTIDFEKQKRPVNYLLNLFSLKPFFVWRKYHKNVQRIVDEIFEKGQFDFIHVDGLGAAQFVLPYINTPRIIDARDALSLSLYRHIRNHKNMLSKVYYWLKLLRLRHYELKIYSALDQVVFISKVDEEAIFLLSKGKSNNLATIPFGVDIPKIKDKFTSKFPTLIFTGNMPYGPNKDAMLYFCRDIFPGIKREIPDVRLYIVGRDPGPEVQNLSREGDIIVTGEVEDMKAWLEKSTLFVCPLRYGSGMKIKVLEAMAMAKPIVSTSIGVDGIRVRNGEDVFIADDAASFALRTVELLRDEKLRYRFGENSRKLVKEEYTWEIASSKFNNLYSEVIDSYRKRNISKVRLKKKIQESLARVSI